MSYRIALTLDDVNSEGHTSYGNIGLSRLAEAGIEWDVLAESPQPLEPRQLHGYNALLVLKSEQVTAETLTGLPKLGHIARFGAGFDAIDIDACTRAGVIVTNTPTAVSGPMADSAVALLFALAHNLVVKDSLVRDGRWAERTQWRGVGLASATIGIVGLGNVGELVAKRCLALGLTVIASNRSDRSACAAALGIEYVGLDDLLTQSDFVIVTVSANPSSHNLIGERELALMKSTGYFVNIARGSVVDERALIEALRSTRIAGAGLDVFEREPINTDNPLLAMPNVILAPHSLCWTDAFTESVGRSVIDALIAVAQRHVPEHVVNPAVLQGRPRDTTSGQHLANPSSKGPIG